MAVINAQAASAMTTVNFINSVGFYPNGSAIMVDFKYTTIDSNGTESKRKLSVPFLSMLPIPNLEVRHVEECVLNGDVLVRDCNCQ